MAVDIDAKCEAAAEAIRNGTGLRAKGYPDDTINPPEVQIQTRDFDPRLVFDSAKSRVPMVARLFVPRTSARAAHDLVRGYMGNDGAKSIPVALETSENWRADVDFVEVTSIGQPFEVSLALTEQTVVTYLAVDFEFDVCW
jgi:hypothetical protein